VVHALIVREEMRRRIAPIWIVGLFPMVVGVAIALYLFLTAPGSWEGFGWNPRIVEAFKVLALSAGVSLGTLIVFLAFRGITMLWNIGRPTARISALLIGSGFTAGIILLLGHLLRK
jgi:hypothetical protein